MAGLNLSLVSQIHLQMDDDTSALKTLRYLLSEPSEGLNLQQQDIRGLARLIGLINRSLTEQLEALGKLPDAEEKGGSPTPFPPGMAESVAEYFNLISKGGRLISVIQMRGSSMVGDHIFGGDLVFYLEGETTHEGLHVVEIAGKPHVCYVQETIAGLRLISSRKHGETVEVVPPDQMHRVRVVGYVTGWMTQNLPVPREYGPNRRPLTIHLDDPAEHPA